MNLWHTIYYCNHGFTESGSWERNPTLSCVISLYTQTPFSKNPYDTVMCTQQNTVTNSSVITKEKTLQAPGRLEQYHQLSIHLVEIVILQYLHALTQNTSTIFVLTCHVTGWGGEGWSLGRLNKSGSWWNNTGALAKFHFQNSFFLFSETSV